MRLAGAQQSFFFYFFLLFLFICYYIVFVIFLIFTNTHDNESSSSTGQAPAWLASLAASSTVPQPSSLSPRRSKSETKTIVERKEGIVLTFWIALLDNGMVDRGRKRDE